MNRLCLLAWPIIFTLLFAASCGDDEVDGDGDVESDGDGDGDIDGDSDSDVDGDSDGDGDSDSDGDSDGDGDGDGDGDSDGDPSPDTVLWVDNENGDDENDGSEGAPLATIGAGFDHLDGLTHINVRATSTSYEGVCVWESNLAIIGIEGTPLIDTFVECDGRNSLLFSRGDDVRFENFTLDASAFAGQHVRALLFSGLPDEPVYRNIGRRIEAMGPGFGQPGRSLISSSLCYDCVLENSSSVGAEEHGIYWTNHQDGSVIRNNYIEAADGACIQLNSDPETFDPDAEFQDGVMSESLVEGNILYNCGTHGSSALNLAGVHRSIFRNNLIYGDALSGGIASWDDDYSSWGDSGNFNFGCKDNLYINNTVDCRSCDRHAMSFRNGSTGNVFRNNIVLTSDYDAIAVDTESNSNLDIDTNLYLSSTFFENSSEDWIDLDEWIDLGYDENSLSVDIIGLFENIGNDDYHLADGSPAIDEGSDVDVSIDIEGTSRPRGDGFDIGAYER